VAATPRPLPRNATTAGPHLEFGVKCCSFHPLRSRGRLPRAADRAKPSHSNCWAATPCGPGSGHAELPPPPPFQRPSHGLRGGVIDPHGRRPRLVARWGGQVRSSAKLACLPAFPSKPSATKRPRCRDHPVAYRSPSGSTTDRVPSHPRQPLVAMDLRRCDQQRPSRWRPGPRNRRPQRSAAAWARSSPPAVRVGREPNGGVRERTGDEHGRRYACECCDHGERADRQPRIRASASRNTAGPLKSSTFNSQRPPRRGGVDCIFADRTPRHRVLPTRAHASARLK